MNAKNSQISTAIVLRGPGGKSKNKKNKNKNRTQVVLLPSNPSKKRGRRLSIANARGQIQAATGRLYRSPSTFLDMGMRLKIAFANPFDPRAIGITAPDDWPCPSLTPFHLRFRTSVTSSGTNCALVAIACPGASLLTGNGFFTSTGPFSGFNAAGTLGIVGTSTDSALSTAYDLFRPIVGAIRIHNNMPFNTITGQATFVTVPCSDRGKALNQTILTNAVNNAELLVRAETLGGVDIPSGAMAVLPGSSVVHADQLISQDVMVRLLPCGPTAYRWRNVSATTGTVTATTTLTGQNVVTTATGLINAYAEYETCDPGDFTAGCFYMDGCVTGSPVIYLDYILHCEGRQYLTGAGSANTMQTSVFQAAPPPMSFLTGLLSKLPEISAMASEAMAGLPPGLLPQMLGRGAQYLLS